MQGVARDQVLGSMNIPRGLYKSYDHPTLYQAKVFLGNYNDEYNDDDARVTMTRKGMKRMIMQEITE